MSTRVARWLAWSLVALTVALDLGTLPQYIAVTRAASAPGTPFPPAAAAHMQAPWHIATASLSPFLATARPSSGSPLRGAEGLGVRFRLPR
jgi:hypothetical protein